MQTINVSKIKTYFNALLNIVIAKVIVKWGLMDGTVLNVLIIMLEYKIMVKMTNVYVKIYKIVYNVMVNFNAITIRYKLLNLLKRV